MGLGGRKGAQVTPAVHASPGSGKAPACRLGYLSSYQSKRLEHAPPSPFVGAIFGHPRVDVEACLAVKVILQLAPDARIGSVLMQEDVDILLGERGMPSVSAHQVDQRSVEHEHA